MTKLPYRVDWRMRKDGRIIKQSDEWQFIIDAQVYAAYRSECMRVWKIPRPEAKLYRNGIQIDRATGRAI